jgi:tetratricopeptide (TPR) repeat protein
MERAERSWSLGLFLQLFPSALSVVGSLALTPDNGDCVRFGPGARFRRIIPKLLRAGRSILASPRRKQPPADPYAPARESWNNKNHDAAIASLDQILAATPTDVTALLMKGQVLLSSGRAREARDPLIKALDLDPENVGALETLAYAEGALNEHDRALTCWRRLAVRKGLDESTARMIGNETWARDEQRRNSSAFKDLEEGCPPIEQCLSEITRLTASGADGSPRYQEIIERLCYQIAAQKGVLGRLDNVENFYEYSLVRLRFRNMGVHSYDDVHLKAPPDPPAQIPDPLRNAFSMGGVVELLQGYTNSALPPGCGEYIDDDAIRTFLALNQQSMTPRAQLKAAEILTGFAPPEHALTKKNFSRSGGERKQGIMPPLPAMVPPDLDLDERSVAVMDSPDYFLDAMLTCLAKDVTSVRRSKVNGETKLLRTVALSDWLREDSRYDLIICPLMLDSWGLGRNGEPIDPDADVALMREFHQKLRPAGLLYLRVPIGRDRLIFNTMRIYGAHRLPRLLANWRQRSPETIGAEQLSARVPAGTKLLLERA